MKPNDQILVRHADSGIAYRKVLGTPSEQDAVAKGEIIRISSATYIWSAVPSLGPCAFHTRIHTHSSSQPGRLRRTSAQEDRPKDWYSDTSRPILFS
jgi:hypothetical protein